MESHYTYIIQDMETREFYIGVRSCEGLPENDKYMGSMKGWTRQKDFDRSRHEKTIINTYETREIANDVEYELIQNFINDPLNRNYFTGKTYCTKGIAISEEHKRKISEGSKRKTHSEEAKKKQSEANKGKKHTEEARRKMREAKKDFIPWNKGKKVKQITCPHCGLTGGNSNMKRYHFDNCKKKGPNN